MCITFNGMKSENYNVHLLFWLHISLLKACMIMYFCHTCIIDMIHYVNNHDNVNGTLIVALVYLMNVA